MVYEKEEVRNILREKAEEKYRVFSSSLLPNTNNLLGVRIPTLRKLAKEIYKKTKTAYLEETNLYFFEEIMLQGMIIGLLKDDISTVKKYIRNFIPKIDNWSICDCFCGDLKIIKGNEEYFLEFIKPYLQSKKEFEVRFVLVILLNYYVNEKYIETTLELINKFNHSEYYAKMAAAWAISICYIKFPQHTYEFLQNTKIDSWTFNKAIQKIKESYKVDINSKKLVEKLKK